MTRNEQLFTESYTVALRANSAKAGYDFLVENGYEFESKPLAVKNKNRVYVQKNTGMVFELGKKDGKKWIAKPLDGSYCFMIDKSELESECEKVKL